MLNLISYLLNQGIATAREICPDLPEGVRGLPMLTETPCISGCTACIDICPTDAISSDELIKIDDCGTITLDLGACISCGYCVDVCPTGTIKNNPSTRVAVRKREDLILTSPGAIVTSPSTDGDNESKNQQSPIGTVKVRPLADDLKNASWFKRSVAARVVSTGCSACDMELGAANNPIFDMERFGVHVVASPRFADALIVTGPVSLGMQEALKSCYGAMSSPRVVVALGTCAISGGVHKGGYAKANGVEEHLPVNVYVPGCPPHPWSIIHGMLLAMGKENLLK
jgi:Ni,Fe-hydrogenase III small subunit/formate hydrogenlyase subunit 6/NADH:ubiquinone oxidoreductase subunit I